MNKSKNFVLTFVSRASWLAIGAGFTLCAACVTVCGAANRPKNADSTPVREILEAEAAGQLQRRTEPLAEVAKHAPDLPEARWHAGFIRWNNEWQRLEAPAEDSTFQKKMEPYYAKRDAAGLTVAAQWNLASWCRRNDLPDQERAHLIRVLELAPDHEAARHRLGWRRVGDRWFTKYEVDTAREELEANRKAFATWAPQLKRLLSTLKNSNPREREEAEKKLQAIQTPEALDALERMSQESPEDVQLKLVDIIDKMKSPKASLLLAKIALTDPFGSLGHAACKALRNRPENHYVPALLGELSCPLASRTALYQEGFGRIVLYQEFARELADRKQKVTVIQTFRDNDQGRFNRAGIAQLVHQAKDQDHRGEDQSARIELRNKGAMRVLQDATGESLAKDAKTWWQWWYDRNGVTPHSDKPLENSSYIANYEIQRPQPLQLLSSFDMLSCFVAGTPVWTSRGSVAIEKIKAGDMVLSQNIETGELTYKPVLRPTVRPPVPILSLKLEKETIRCSQGHPFWQSGKGWVMARHLEAGNRLHDVAGTSEVLEVVQEEVSEEVYNLIVADFHNYFVGNEKVLCHDNTMREPTSAIVPGLVAK